jgi:hypothetical protein
MIIKIYLGKNKDKTAEKHPDLKIAIMKKEGEKTVFIPAGALWKSKNGSGYVGELDTEAVPYKKPETKPEVQSEDIPF